MHEQDECERQLFDHAQLLHNLSAHKAATNLSVSLSYKIQVNINIHRVVVLRSMNYVKRKSTPSNMHRSTSQDAVPANWPTLREE